MTISNTSISNILIDKEDADLDKYRWCYGAGGYIVSALYPKGGNRLNLRLHRLVLARKLDRDLLPGEMSDHINGNKLDNRRSNLRVATSQQNTWNRAKRRNSKSKYKGIWYLSRTRRWSANVKRDGIRIHIGYFPTDTEAAWMHDQFAIALHGEYARLNFDYEPVPDGAGRIAVGEVISGEGNE